MDSLHSNVVLDGELVIDTDPKTGDVGKMRGLFGHSLSVCIQRKLCLLAFDCINVADQNLMSKPLSSRYGVGSSHFILATHK